MENFIILTGTYDSPYADAYYAVHPDQVQTRLVSETYTDFGQKVGSVDAGDWFLIETEQQARYANLFAAGWEVGEETEEYDNLPNKYDVGDVIHAYNSSHVFDLMIDTFDDELTVEGEECECIVFYDGHNWKSLIVNGNDYTDLTRVDDELCAQINNALDNMEFRSKSNGIYSWKSNDGQWMIEKSQWAGTWEDYKITPWNDDAE